MRSNKCVKSLKDHAFHNQESFSSTQSLVVFALTAPFAEPAVKILDVEEHDNMENNWDVGHEEIPWSNRPPSLAKAQMLGMYTIG